MSDQTFRSKVIRLAHIRPELRSDLLPLLRSASRKLHPDDVSTLRSLHENRVLRTPQEEQAVVRVFSMLDDAGEGYDIGKEDDDISSIREAGRLLDTVKRGQIAVYWNPRHLTLVGDIHGPWAVDVTFP